MKGKNVTIVYVQATAYVMWRKHLRPHKTASILKLFWSNPIPLPKVDKNFSENAILKLRHTVLLWSKNIKVETPWFRRDIEII